MFFYRLLIYLALPFIFLSLIIKGFRNRQYWQRIGERFGKLPLNVQQNAPYDLWIHAVSVGETRAIIPFIHAWKKQHPKKNILLTATTPTGSQVASTTINTQLTSQVYHCYLPYDIPWAMRRFIAQTKPKNAMIMETEIWPNMITLIKQTPCQLIYANVRLSARSFKGYQKIHAFLAPIINQVDCFSTQSKQDAQHLSALGVDEQKIHITGNIKFDISIPASLQESSYSVRRYLGSDRLIWIAGSTRDGEEGRLLSVYQQLKVQFPQLLFVLVPRHPERFDSVYRKIIRRKLSCVRRSESTEPLDNTVDVYLGDSMGELALLYASADVAFVGGSLKPFGGQNILEPCALGLPVLFGPHMYNFSDISRWAIEQNAGIQVANSSELCRALVTLLKDANARDSMGEQGKLLIQSHRGAVEKTLRLIDTIIQ